jgi:Skp family chaperone for outer membrane proteins
MNNLGKATVALVSGLLMSLPAALVGESLENQIIYVHLPELMEKSDSGKEKRLELEMIQNTKTVDISEKAKSFEKAKNDLDKARKDLATKRSTLTADALKKEEKKIVELERKVEELQHKLQLAYQDADNELKEVWVRVTESLYKEQVEAISEWAKDKKVYAVIDRESGRVLFCRDNCDMTSEVLKVVNKKHTQKTLLAKDSNALKTSPTKLA